MSNPTKESSGDTSDSVLQMREDNEYVRLVVAHEAVPATETVLSISQSEILSEKLWWWFKALVVFALTLLLTLVFVKWGVPFVFEKVLIPILQWEATAFGRPTLAIVLVVSLALFPVFLIPSGPSMWLAGMIFGYGLGFVIIMVGTTIGMLLPYLIGLMFRDRLHDPFMIDMEPYPTLAKCYKSYTELSVFQDAIPTKQSDAPPTPTT